MKYRSIVISGPVAAGSSTAAKSVAEKLGLEYRAAGDFFRDYMKKHNTPLYAKEAVPDDIERKLDRELTDLAAEKPVVVDSLYAGYFNRNRQDILKVFLTCDQEVRVKRALERNHTHTETAEDVKKRDSAHDLKFRKLYADENFLDPKFFDLVIDTANTTIEETAEKIIERYKGL